MGSFSLMHWLIVLTVVVLIFGVGKLPKAMGDIAKGMKAFRSEMQKPETAADAAAPEAIEDRNAGPTRA